MYVYKSITDMKYRLGHNQPITRDVSRRKNVTSGGEKGKEASRYKKIKRLVLLICSDASQEHLFQSQAIRVSTSRISSIFTSPPENDRPFPGHFYASFHFVGG